MLLERLSVRGALLPPTAWPGDRGHSLELELPPTPPAVSTAREAVRRACTDWGIEHVVDDVVLVVSELVTNAALHAGTPIMLAVDHDHPTVAVAVSDGLLAMPWRPPQSPEREGGRGILLVSELGATWGVVRTVLGKTVWVTLAVPASDLAT